jgi:regulator of nonsense transcripts 2
MLTSQNIRYYGELAKFKVAQPHTILHVLKVCLEDFTGPNIDNVANLLESCGRFLLRNEETSERAKAMVGFDSGRCGLRLDADLIWLAG